MSEPSEDPTDEELLALLLEEDAVEGTTTRIPRADPGEPVVLSFAQQRLWFLQNLDLSSAAYNISTLVKLTGEIDATRLEWALNQIIQRHESLRCSFATVDGRVTPHLHSDAPVRLTTRDVDDSALLKVAQEEAMRPFDLSHAPLLRLTLLSGKSSGTTHAIMVMHHIVSDAWSMENLVRELGSIYSADDSFQLPPLAIQYRDFAAWQRNRLDAGARETQLAYWRDELADPPELHLPLDFNRPEKPDFAGASVRLSIPAAIAIGLQRLITATDTTFFMAMLAAGHAWLRQISGQDDVVLGTPVANRDDADLESLIGFFVNTLALHGRIEPTTTFRDLLIAARETTLGGYANQDVPFETLVGDLVPERDASRNPLFQVMLTAESRRHGSSELNGLGMEAVDLPSTVAKFDLTLSLQETPTGIDGALEYASGLFSPETAQRFTEHFVEGLTRWVEEPDTAISALPRLTSRESDSISTWSEGPTPPYPQTSLTTVFAATVARAPQAIAAQLGDETLTYQQLDQRANQLAHFLREQGVTLDQPVGLCLERSFEMVIAVLAILKADGAYLALDPSYPADRLNTLIQLGNVELVLSNATCGKNLPNAVNVVDTDDSNAWRNLSVEAPASQDSPEQLAYVSFTSGSTGEPKGVAVPHRAVMRLVHGNSFANFGPDETFLLMAPLAFDASTLELWGPLLHGGRLVIMPPGTPTLDEIGQVVREQNVTSLWLTAGLFNLMVDEQISELRGVRQLLAGGDTLSHPHVSRALAELPQTQLINGYGPTENTTFTCCHRISRRDLTLDSIPIGRPIDHTTVAILDHAGNPMPIGVPGELYTGGDGLARGYLGQPKLTAAVFVNDPRNSAQRLYRTGDRASWLPDGTVRFLGRMDRQVKIRGHRIEPDEVEAALRALPDVSDAAIVVEHGPTGKRLIGYVSPQLESSPIIAKLSDGLPDYMIPAVIIGLPSLPLTANGKIDRSALPSPSKTRSAEDSESALPRNDTEQLVAKIWCGVLGLDQIGIHANYFASGGDSIGAIQVASRLRKAGWSMQVSDIFSHPTVARLSQQISRESADASEVFPAHEGPVALNPAQAWFVQQDFAASHHFNQAVLLDPSTPLRADTLAPALAALWQQHDSLRFQLNAAGEGEIAPLKEPSILECVEVPDENARIAHTESVQGSFDLSTGPLFRAVLYQLPHTQRLLLVAHHLVVDGVSWRRLVEDLETAIVLQENGDEIALGPRPLPIDRWSRAMAKRSDHAREYWRDVLKSEGTHWPPPNTAVPNTFGESITIGSRLSAQETITLTTTANRPFNTEVEDLLLLALAKALHLWKGASTTRLMLEGHGRQGGADTPAPEETVGWFTSLFPFRLELIEADWPQQLRYLKESRRAVPDHGNGFGPVAYLHEDDDLRNLARDIPISFNYLGRFEDGAAGRLRFANESSGTPIGSAVQRMHEIDAGAAITGGRLSLSLTLGAKRYSADQSKQLLDDWHRELVTLLEQCAAHSSQEKTPADFTSSVISLTAYDDLLNHYDWTATAVDDVLRLSPMQAGLLFQSVIDQESSAYFVQMAYRLRGRLDADRFVAAWKQLPDRHAILRTSFVHEELSEPLQVVWRERSVEITVIDLRNLDPKEQSEQITQGRKTDLDRPFDLARDSLWRVTVWQLADDLNEIVWSYHHVLLDGWSLGLVQRDLFDLYDGRGELEPTAPYQDYIKWLEQNPPDRARVWWTEHLAGYDSPSSVPEEPSVGETSSGRSEFFIELDAEISEQLRSLAAESGATLATLMQAAWGIWLGRQNRTEDVVFGAIVSGRPSSLEGVENMVGLFICAVPVRIQFRSNETFSDLLERVQSEALAAEPHHHLPLAEIQTLTPRGRDLFDHLLVFENYPLNRTARKDESDPLTIEHIEAHDRTHYNFDLTIDPGETLSLRFGFEPKVHDVAQVTRIAAQFETLLRSVVASPRAPLASRSMLPEPELNRVVREFNQSQFPCPQDITLLDLFEEARQSHPDQDAVVQGDQVLTYQELHDQADALAARLQTQGVRPETIVGLCVGRTSAMIIGVLGIMKAGGAYLPLDPMYPSDRLKGMLADAGTEIIVTTKADVSAIPAPAENIAVLKIDDSPSDQPDLRPASLQPHHLAYTIYTSGSTGRPKGVAVEHRSLVNAAFAWRQGYGIGPGGTRPRILQMASLSFDVFAGDLIRALTNGGTLFLCDADTRIDPEGLIELLRSHRITQFESTPGLILPLMEHVRGTSTALPDLTMLILGSDTLRGSDYRRLVQEFGNGRRIINSYGVTEATIDTCFFEDKNPTEILGEESTPIGRPMANQRLYVLDSQLQPVGIGTSGELFIGGAGLARGYHQQSKLTAEKFPEVDPGDGMQRLYRTGDLARWRADGTLQFLGRNDRQIKVRGVRIELGEIEATLRECPTVKDALVDILEAAENSELVAYVVPEPDSDSRPEIWRNHLLGTLSTAMIPTHWVEIERVPLSPNGKVDRRALPAPTPQAISKETVAVAARNETERAIVPIWNEVLQLTNEDVTADFFDAGGHSLKAMQLLSRIKRSQGVKIRMRAFFENATIAGLAHLVDELEPSQNEGPSFSIPVAPLAEYYPLSFAQQRLWLLHQLGGETAYNMPEAYRIKGPLDGDALETAICRIISRHEALRTGFVEVEGDPVQTVFDDVPFSIKRIDLTATDDAEVQARTLADQEAAAPFDLTSPPLLRGTLIKLGPNDWVYLQTIHHIVGDGWSGNVLYREIFALYHAATNGSAEPLPPLRIHYKDFAIWQKNTPWEREESYWMSALCGAPDSLRLPYDFPVDSHRDFRGDHETFQLSEESTKRLRRVARDRKTTVANTLLAVFDLLLFQLTKQADFCIGVSHANRNHPDLENLLGFFVNLLPVRVQLDDKMDFSGLLDQVVNHSDAAFEHQDYPFDLMVQRLNPDRASNRQPLLNVVYAFQNFGDVHVDVGESTKSPTNDQANVSISPFEHTFHTSKFDLTLFVSDDGETLDLTLEYDTGLFKPASIRRYLTLLDKFSRMIEVPSSSA